MFNFTARTGESASPGQSSFSAGSAGMNQWASRQPPRQQQSISEIPPDQICKQQLEWDTDMDNLDKKQEQLLNDQWRLLRTQIGSLMGALAQVRNELNELKDNTVNKEVENVIEKMCSAHDEHSRNHGGMAERLQYLEQYIGESLEKHQKDPHKMNMETRLEFLESKFGDSADAHAQELESAKGRLDALHAAVSLCAVGDHHSTLEQRVNYLEKFLGESADAHEKDLAAHKDAHDEHKTTMETRLEYVEGLLGDSADKHAKEIEAAHGKMADLHASIMSCAKADHHSSLQERMEYLESFLGESADKHTKELEDHKGAHDDHKTSMETRLEYIESLLGDSADKHAKALGAANEKLQDLHAAISLCAKSEHHANLEMRLDYLEKCLGESADNHENHKTTMETRLEYMEGLMGDSAEKHATEINAAHLKCQDLHAAIANCAKSDHHAVLEECVNKVVRDMSKRMDMQDEKHQEVSGLARKLLGSHEEHKESQKDLADKVKLCGKAEQHSAVEKRVAYLEKFLGESVDNHDDHKTTMETRLEYIETMIGDSADKHAKEINAAKDKMKDLHSAIASCAKSEHHSNLEIRMETVEAALGGTTDKLEKTTRDLESATTRVKELQAKMSGDGSARDQNHATIEERLGTVENKLANDGSNQLRKLSGLEAGQAKLKAVYDELNTAFRGEKTDRDINSNKLDERLTPIERMCNEVMQGTCKEVEAAQARLRELFGKVEAHKATVESHKATTDQRLAYVENIMAEQGGAKVTEFTKDMEQRFAFWQDDQKRARDVLESSIQEQLRLEHSARDAQAGQIKEQWDREMKARQAYQESYKELLSHERAAREVSEGNFANRVHQCEQQCEQRLAGEAQRLWLALDGHTHDALEPPEPVIIEAPPPVMVSPRMASYTVQAPPVIVSKEQILVNSPPVPAPVGIGHMGGIGTVTRMISTGPPGGSMSLGQPVVMARELGYLEDQLHHHGSQVELQPPHVHTTPHHHQNPHERAHVHTTPQHAHSPATSTRTGNSQKKERTNGDHGSSNRHAPSRQQQLTAFK